MSIQDIKKHLDSIKNTPYMFNAKSMAWYYLYSDDENALKNKRREITTILKKASSGDIKIPGYRIMTEGNLFKAVRV